MKGLCWRYAEPVQKKFGHLLRVVKQGICNIIMSLTHCLCKNELNDLKLNKQRMIEESGFAIST